MTAQKIIISLLVLMSSLGIGAENLRLPRFFSDGMVLQRGTKIPVWGWAEPGSTVQVEFAGKKVKTTVKSDGTWKVYLPKQKANFTPQELKVTCTSSAASPSPTGGRAGLGAVIKNVLVGDVFLGSGQSNMELPIRRCMDVVAEKVKTYSNPNLRYLKLPHQFNYVEPQTDVTILPWQDITPENCGEVSGICYFMARSIQEEKNVPVGIINSAVGGTPVESWMPREVLSQQPEYIHEMEKAKYNQPNWVDSVRRAEFAAAGKWDRDMISQDTVVNRWKSTDILKTAPKVDIFSDWHHGKNGSYWFRTVVNIPSAANPSPTGGRAGLGALIRVGALKDADSVFINGTFVGNTTYEYPPRIYNIPAGVLHEGDNEVVIHLMSQSGRPSFNAAKLYQIEIGDQIYKLDKEMNFAVGSLMPQRPTNTYFVSGFTGLYNAMIAPFQNLPFAGILWYQGEANMGNPKQYARYLGAMVESWRKQQGKQTPFVVVQLPGYMRHSETPVKYSGWCEIREQQRLAALQIPRAALVTTLDTGEAADIHPQDKDVAGYRSALQMRKLVYGEKKLKTEGPRALTAVRQSDGSVLVTFSDGQTKSVTSQSSTWSIVNEGKTLRYCYDDYPKPEVFSAEGIPTPQFEIQIK